MPTYEYKCENGHIYIEMRRITDGDMPKSMGICKVCGTQQKRWFNDGNTRIAYKGDGYYFSRDNPPTDGKEVKG